MFILRYGKALKELEEENKKLTINLEKAYRDIFNLQHEIEKLTQKVNKQRKELKNSTYIWK